jgi:transketolase
MRKVFTDHMLTVGKEDPNLVVLVGDISHFALQGFANECPGRFYNVGILEPTMVGMAAGLARTGLNTVAHTIAPFLIERSFEQIKLDFCYQGIGGTLISVGSAFDYSKLGCSHHTYNDMGMIKSLPNTQVIYPASPIEFTKLFNETYRNNQLTYFRLPTAEHGITFDSSQIKLGKGMRVLEGSDVTLVGAGPHLKTVMQAAEKLKHDKVSAEVLYFPCLKPFDESLLRESAAKTKHVLVVEEHSSRGGFFEETLSALRLERGPIADTISIPLEFQRGYGKYDEHLNKLGLTAENVAFKAKSLLNLH